MFYCPVCFDICGLGSQKTFSLTDFFFCSKYHTMSLKTRLTTNSWKVQGLFKRNNQERVSKLNDGDFLNHIKSDIVWAPSSEFVSSSIPSWQNLTAHAQPFRGARDLAFCLKVPLDSLLVWASSEGSGETARMRRLAWTFAARIGYKYQIRLTRSVCLLETNADNDDSVSLKGYRLLKHITRPRKGKGFYGGIAVHAKINIA